MIALCPLVPHSRHSVPRRYRSSTAVPRRPKSLPPLTLSPKYRVVPHIFGVMRMRAGVCVRIILIISAVLCGTNNHKCSYGNNQSVVTPRLQSRYLCGTIAVLLTISAGLCQSRETTMSDTAVASGVSWLDADTPAACKPARALVEARCLDCGHCRPLALYQECAKGINCSSRHWGSGKLQRAVLDQWHWCVSFWDRFEDDELTR